MIRLKLSYVCSTAYKTDPDEEQEESGRESHGNFIVLDVLDIKNVKYKNTEENQLYQAVVREEADFISPGHDVQLSDRLSDRRLQRDRLERREVSNF